jgi:mono/diheme cytochrome c family protein
MTPHSLLRGVGAALLGLASAAGLAAPADYDAVAPLFAARCVMCHSGPQAPLGLRLDSYDNLMKGSQRGAVVRPREAGSSELLRRLKGESQPRMPMTGPPYLSDAEIALVENWIAAGAPPGRGPKSTTPPAAAPRPAAGEAVTYAHVAPLFATRCAKCHTDNGSMGPPPEGFRLTSYAATLSAADRARVVPGQPLASELVRRIRGMAQPRMPFDGPPYLSEDEMRLIEDWIVQGARDAAGKPAAAPLGARVRLHGRLDASGQLDGLPLALEGARIDKRPGPGDYVELRGSVAAGGRIDVERLRRR